VRITKNVMIQLVNNILFSQEFHDYKFEGNRLYGKIVSAIKDNAEKLRDWDVHGKLTNKICKVLN
jgi:hypothetical protein